MTIKELKFIAKASKESPDVGELSTNGAPLGVAAEMMAALSQFAKDTGADPLKSQISFFEGSLGMTYSPDPLGQSYTLPVLKVSNHEFEGAFTPDDPYYKLVHRMEVIARKGHVDIDIQGAGEELHITPSSPAGLQLRQDTWVKTELGLYGQLTDVGGQTPNVHLDGDDGVRYTIGVTRKQATELRVYERYYVRVEGLTSLEDATRNRDVKLLDYEWLSDSREITVDEFIRREQKNWQGVGNAVDWIRARRRSNDDD
jgi:hypothetical protein